MDGGPGSPRLISAARPTPLLAWLILGLTSILALIAAVLTVMAWRDQVTGDAVANLMGSPSAIVYAALGVLIIRRVGNPIGRLLLFIGLVSSVMCLGSAYAILGVVTFPGALPASNLVGAVAELAFIPTLFGVAAMLLVFPTGRLPSPKWLPVAGLWIGLAGILLAGLAMTPRLIALPAPGGVSLTFPNPFGIDSLKLLSMLFSIGGPAIGLVSVAVFTAAFVALVVRYRSGDPVSKQQIRWLAFLAVAAVVFQLAGALVTAGCGCDGAPVAFATGFATGFIALIGFPTAITIAILRYRLYEIDRIINRALVYGLLTAILAAVYVGLTLGAGSLLGSNSSSLVIAGSTLVVAALFRTARARIQELIDRRFYRHKYDAQRTLEEFSVWLRSQVDLAEVRVHLLAVIAEAVQPASISLWIPRDDGGRAEVH